MLINIKKNVLLAPNLLRCVEINLTNIYGRKKGIALK